jgi:cytochrome c2
LIPVGKFSYKINNGAIKGKFDRIYAFLILPQIKSIVSLDVNPENGTFKFFPEDNVWGYVEGMEIWAISVCIKDGKLYFDKKEYNGGKDMEVELNPTEISRTALDEKLAYEKSYKDFNKIEVEIELREKIHAKNVKIEEHRRIEGMMSEITYLVNHSCRCCDNAEVAIARELFLANCSVCHEVYKDKVGPALLGVTKRRSREFIQKFIRNSQRLIKVERDPVAMELYAKYNNTEMTAFPALTDCEIESIILYLEKEEIMEE